MSARGRFVGLLQLREELGRLPFAFTAAARGLVRDAAVAAQADIVRQFPIRTGRLRRSVGIVTVKQPPAGAALGIEVGAPYWPYVDARYRVLRPTMRRYREQLERDGAELLRRAGFEVRVA